MFLHHLIFFLIKTDKALNEKNKYIKYFGKK